MQMHFNKRLVAEDLSGTSHETSSYTEDSSELQDDIDEHAAFRRKILRDPNFYKQLTLSFYSRKDSQVEPSPRIVQKVQEPETQRTPTPKENHNAQIADARQTQRGFLSPPQRQRSPNFAVQQSGFAKGGRETPNHIPREYSTNENYNHINRPAPTTTANISEKNSNKSSKQVTPKTFKISTVTGIDMKRALFQIPSPVLKREPVKSKSPVGKTEHLAVPTYNGKLNSALSSGTVSVVPSTGATTPKYIESFVNAPTARSEREKLQQQKTLKMPANKTQLKIKVPGQEEAAPMRMITKNPVQQSVRSSKVTSPIGFKSIETPAGSKTVMNHKQIVTPSRPMIPGVGNGGQFRAARKLFQKENKAPEPEHQQEKLFESKA